MNCKNCNASIEDSSNYCPVCGGKVVTKRIHTKALVIEFLTNYIGWDNRFFLTLRRMILRPASVISDYIQGVRSRYMPPLVFVSLGVALVTITYNIFSEEYLELASATGKAQLELIQDSYDEGNISQEQYDSQIDALETNNRIQEYSLKYFNIISFLILPFYALISRLIFGGKFNYAEHLVINSYIQGLSFFLAILTFFLAIYVYEPIFYFQLLFLIFYYLWTFAKLMNFGVGKALLKLLLFFGILLLIMLAFVIIGVIFAFIDKM